MSFYVYLRNLTQTERNHMVSNVKKTEGAEYSTALESTGLYTFKAYTKEKETLYDICNWMFSDSYISEKIKELT